MFGFVVEIPRFSVGCFRTLGSSWLLFCKKLTAETMFVAPFATFVASPAAAADDAPFSLQQCSKQQRLTQN